jgi:hypothetical protein
MARDIPAVAIAIIVVCATSAAVASASAQPTAPATGNPGVPAAEQEPPRYVPPMRGAPRGRVGGASRGGGASNVAALQRIDVIAPDHVGLTRREQPTLYWFSKNRFAAPIVFTLIADDAEKPLIESKMPGPREPGIHAVSLAGGPVRLVPRREYEWSISILGPGGDRSSDIVASGLLKLDTSAPVPPADAPALDAARIDARNGRFYDAIDDLSRALDGAAFADATALRFARAALLDQVGLNDAAAYDRSRR